MKRVCLQCDAGTQTLNHHPSMCTCQLHFDPEKSSSAIHSSKDCQQNGTFKGGRKDTVDWRQRRIPTPNNPSFQQSENMLKLRILGLRGCFRVHNQTEPRSWLPPLVGVRASARGGHLLLCTMETPPGICSVLIVRRCSTLKNLSPLCQGTGPRQVKYTRP